MKHRLLFIFSALSSHEISCAFTTGPSGRRIARGSTFVTPSTLLVSINNSNGEASPKKGPPSSSESSRQSVLYYDKTTEDWQDRKRKKEKELNDRKIAVYHNKLQKNANDCSVCTVPDKIDASKIASSKTDKTNGVTPVRVEASTADKLLELKKSVNQLIQEPSVELADTLLILFSSFLMALTTVPTLPPTLMYAIYFCQDATLFLFAFGFLTRWLSSLEPRGSYFKDSLEWIDTVVVMLPFLFLTVPGLSEFFPPWLTSQTTLINLRLLRVLRFQRILQDEFTFSRFVAGLRFGPSEDPTSCVIVELWQLQLARVLLSVFTLLSVSTGLIYAAEHSVNPGIADYFSALYCKWSRLRNDLQISFADH